MEITDLLISLIAILSIYNAFLQWGIDIYRDQERLLKEENEKLKKQIDVKAKK